MRIISIGMAFSQLSEISIGMYLVNYQSDKRGKERNYRNNTAPPSL
jgi:hypothetical protein